MHYLKNLEEACKEFYGGEELIEILNECFKTAYRETFGKEPTGKNLAL